MAISAVSKSRISPTMMTFGSWRKIWRRPIAKVRPMSERTAMLLGFAAVVSGFATLVWRLRPGDDEDDNGPDDGARV